MQIGERPSHLLTSPPLIHLESCAIQVVLLESAYLLNYALGFGRPFRIRTFRQEEFNNSFAIFKSVFSILPDSYTMTQFCMLNRSLPFPATTSVTTSVTSQTSLNLARNKALCPPPHHGTTTQVLQDKSKHDDHHADAAHRRRQRQHVISCMCSSSHLSSAFTSAPFDMRSSTIDG